MPTKILLDTDIGSDVDDAVCLAYLLANPKCELLGITTVTGEAEKRAMIASALCKVANKDVPIFPGLEKPLLVSQQQPHAPQAAALSKWKHEEKFPHGQAIEFMRRTIREHPGEVVLLSIGPLTNVGLLFAVDPEIPSLLKGLVMMCGRFTNHVLGNYGPLEWNACSDPHASAIVYRANVRMHRSVGLDVTSHVSMSAQEFREKFRSIELFGPVLDFAEIWFQNWEGTTFHDPLAAATIFDDKICTFEKGRVEIELASEKLRGFTSWNPNANDAKHEIAVEVNQERFFEHYNSVFQ